MIKLEDLLKEIEQQQLDEAGLKDWGIAAIVGLAGLFNSGKAQTTDTMKVDMSTLFPSGKHIIRDKAKLGAMEAQIAGFMSKDPRADYIFHIKAMSSNVPNHDAERPGNPPVDFKFLPHERASEVRDYLEAFVEDAKRSGAFKGSVRFEEEELPGIGPEWYPEKGDKASDEKFTENQGVEVDVKAITKSTPVPTQAFKHTGEPLHLNGGVTIASIFYSTEGDAGYRDVLLKVLKPNTPYHSNIDEDVYTESYYIKAADWNKIMGTEHNASTNQFNQLKKMGTRLSGNATTVASPVK